MNVLDTELLVIGGGIAGAYAALTARSFGAEVVLACKTGLLGGSTRWAQGGIAAPLTAEDERLHARDTEQAGRGLCEPATVAAFVREARAHVETLRDLGVAFAPYGTLEGGHSRPRIRHAGDATGWAIQRVLKRALEQGEGPGLRLFPCAFARNLRLAAGRVVGADFITPQGALRVRAGGVVLATGGFGRLYPVTTAPPEGTGDGLALAYRAGAVLRDLEFVQFHPTAVVVGGAAHLVTEAARGEGGLLLNARGERFMTRYSAALELAPRDVVARAVAAEITATGGVFLDLRHLGADFVQARFPTVAATLRPLGLDLGRDLIPVQPAVHYTVGGIQTDTAGRTTLPGLFAAGEVASSGLHGANRLASNSLSEGLVFGARAVRAALAELPQALDDGTAVAAPGADPTGLDALRQRLSRAAGLRRNAASLQAALAEWDLATVPGDTRSALEAAHLALIGQLVLQGALAREESRGGHCRSDFPQEGRPAHTLQYRDSTAGTDHLEQAPVGAAMLRFSA
ncbi:L-aspartate oxidase [Deinococcus sp. YIM 77859]|uniref:L-aspartate oxidase n=1 Tax=Deinococcus sp. YIM 77859 TaxID=1540221 RepID=UPI00054FF8D2|nr:FAD-binding protein [Deinococcus sp. YIM 77859]